MELGIRNRKIGVQNLIIFNPKTISTLQSLIGTRNLEFGKNSSSLFTIDKQIYRLPPQLGSHSIKLDMKKLSHVSENNNDCFCMNYRQKHDFNDHLTTITTPKKLQI
jgi:hypothetical protein